MNERDIRKILVLTISLTAGLVISGNALAEGNSWFGGLKTKIYKVLGHKSKGLRGQVNALDERVDAVEEQVDKVEARVGAVEAQVDANTKAIDGKQDPVTVICPPGEALVKIFPDGDGECASAGTGSGGPPPADSVDSSTIRDGSILPQDLAVSEHVLAIPPEAFVDSAGGAMMNFNADGGAFLDPGNGTMVTPINLPHGARITRVEAWVFDNVTPNLQVILAHRDPSVIGSADTLVMLTSSGRNMAVVHLSSGDISIDVNNIASNYHLRVFANWPDPQGSLSIFGAQITYEH